jgi:2-polyprenyl-3-methyl-5-hydroxy-6-metoxy-1,4-benzoquinol methylase
MDNKVKSFFEENAESWVLNGYNDDGYNYPTAYHRARIINKILKEEKNKLNVVDLGCGSGNVSIILAKQGHSVVGIDESKSMIELSKKEKNKLSNVNKLNLEFKNQSITDNSLEAGYYDVCIAMGVIGYFDKDEILFNEAKRLLKPGGLFIVSFRNRLFNMQSLSFRTINEIKSNNAINLINEIEELYERVPEKNVEDLLNVLKKSVSKIPLKNSYDKEKMKSPNEKKEKGASYKPFYEPRQHTPKQITNISNKIGFKAESFFGVHPHLIDPNLNKLLPPKLFNKISTCLEPLEDLPISLVWSSVFIGTFYKK